MIVAAANLVVGHLRRGIELDGSPKIASRDLAYKSETNRYIYIIVVAITKN